MARVLLLNPNRWGRGITTIWIASHAAALKQRRHEVQLFDATFYRDWAHNEVEFNTQNLQYQPTPYESLIVWKSEPVRVALQRALDRFQPDVVFWSALSSHIHGEGEYVNIQYGEELMKELRTPALRVAGGLQPTAAPQQTWNRFPTLDLLIGGESEFVLAELVDAVTRDGRAFDRARIAGLIWRDAENNVVVNARQPILKDMDSIAPYDYSLFEDQVFLRPYNGGVVRAADYELSRGCIYACTYCVETVIQRYYGFTELTPRGALVSAKAYLRNKSAARVYEELSWLHRERGVTLVRCQDTNFLTIERAMLTELAGLLAAGPLPIRMYIETRPEGINPGSAALLNQLQVDGVGMGIELSTQSFRERNLNRFADTERIVAAFRLLRGAGIRRTAYNIIGLAGQDEESIKETIEFNRELDPDNITVAFYSPYLGTQQHEASASQDYFRGYEFDVDSQLRTLSHHREMTKELLDFYKANFVRLVRSGLSRLPELKKEAGL
jgi:anaerobic magnesium-protoporphyrin IX monomethyl ester cyclase